MNRPSQHANRSRRTWCLLLLALLLTAVAERADAMSARMFQDDASGAVMEISLSSPAPPTLIVEISVPHGIQVSNGSPPPAKIDRKKGVIRWLLKDLQPGVFTLRLVTAQPLPLQQCNGIVRYRQPGSGKMVEVRATR